MAVTISHHQLYVWTPPLSFVWHEKLYKSAASLPAPASPLRIDMSKRSCGERAGLEGVLASQLPTLLWSGLLIQRLRRVSNFNDIPLAYPSGCLATGFELGLSFDSHTSDSEKHFLPPPFTLFPPLLILPPLKPFPLWCQYGWAERRENKARGAGQPGSSYSWSHIKDHKQSHWETLPDKHQFTESKCSLPSVRGWVSFLDFAEILY